MEQNGTVYFSPKYSTRQVEDYLQNLKVNSPEEQWERAVDMFDDRIKGRYFCPIHHMTKNRHNVFAVASLDCLLIETFAQFFNGVSQFASRDLGERYAEFLQRCVPGIEEQAAKDFYAKIRCGLLHSAEAKGQSYLWLGAKTAIDYDEAGNLRVSVDKLTDALENYFQNYKKDLLAGDNRALRVNFIKKMKAIKASFPVMC